MHTMHYCIVWKILNSQRRQCVSFASNSSHCYLFTDQTHLNWMQQILGKIIQKIKFSKGTKNTWSDTFRYLQYKIARLAFSTIYQHCFHCLKKSPQRFSSSPSLYLLFSPFYIKGKAKTKPKSCHHFSSAVVKAKMERGSYWSLLSWPGSPYLGQKDDPACAQNRYYVTVFLHNMIKQDFIWVICHSVPDSFGARGNRREGWEPTWKLSSWKFRPFYLESCHLCVLLPAHVTFLASFRTRLVLLLKSS